MEKSKFYCELCKFKCNFNSEYDKHLNSAKHKRGGKKKEYNCDICNYKTTISLWNLKMHQSAKHSTKEEREASKYYCKVCDAIFFSPLYYNNHLKSIIHNNNKDNSEDKHKLSLLDRKLIIMKEDIKKELYNELRNELKNIKL